jgi:NAD(P)-dependent dehydrogenase (short-subunit alcohol dehydrogenase family)
VRSLEGRVAVLVGGGGGIGVACAVAFANHGAKVVVADIQQELADHAAAAIADAGGEGLGVTVDALEEGSVDALVDDVVQRYGRLDIMHNLTSTTVLSPSVDLTTEQFERVLRTTVVAQFAGARAAARYMIKAAAGGSVINMSSIGGHGGMPQRAAYTASAAAIINLTRTLAVEWAEHGIRVNAIAPSWILTDALRNYDKQYPGVLDFDALQARVPAGRFGAPEEVADVAVFLASDASRFVTGVTLPVDGGVLSYLGPARPLPQRQPEQAVKAE